MMAAAGIGPAPAGRAPWRDGGIWIGAGALAVGLHVAALAALLNAPPPSAPPGIEEAFAVEMAPEMFAPPADLVSDTPPEIAPPVETATLETLPDAPPVPVESAPPPPDTLPPPEMAELAEAEPPPPELVPPEAPEPPPEPLPEPLPEPVVETPPEDVPDLPEMAEAEALLPRVEPVPAPPRPPEPKPEARREQPRRPPPPAAAPTTTPAAAPAPQAAAPPAGAAQSSPQQVKRWVDQVNAVVLRHMRRWRNPGQTQTLNFLIRFDAAGRITGVNMQGTTGDPATDATLLAHARRLPSLPAPPAGQALQVQLPVVLRR